MSPERLGRPECLRMRNRPNSYDIPKILQFASAKIANPRRVNDYGMNPVVIELNGIDDNWTRVYSSGWRSSERRRQLVEITINVTTKQTDVEVITNTTE